MASGAASLPDLSPTPVYDSPPPQPAGHHHADLLNLMWESPGDPVGSSPPKRTRQAESSPGGMTDTTNLEENVTMEAIARTLQMQLQQERQVLTGEIHRAMSQVNSRVDDVEKALGNKISDAVGMLQELAATQRTTTRGQAGDRGDGDADACQPHRGLGSSPADQRSQTGVSGQPRRLQRGHRGDPRRGVAGTPASTEAGGQPQAAAEPAGGGKLPR